MSVGRDISHHNPIQNYDDARGATDWWQIKITESNNFTDNMAAQHYRGLAGDVRGPYHFARPVNLRDQIAHFLSVKAKIGSWERPDMLDCEFSGVDSVFIKAIVAEYRRQSGIRKLFVYLGYYDVTHACNPAGWWDPDIYIWVARYRKIGPPAMDGSNWKTHLGFDHPGLTTYQWDNATRIPGGDPDADVNYERTNRIEGDKYIMDEKTITDAVMERAIPEYTSDNPEDTIRFSEAAARARQDAYQSYTTALRIESKLDKLISLLSGNTQIVGEGQITFKPVTTNPTS